MSESADRISPSTPHPGAARAGLGMTRWHILALLFLARIALGFQFQTVASVGDGLIVAHGLDYAAIGLLIGLFMAPGMVLAIPAGLSGRFLPDRWIVTIGLSTLALGGMISGLAPDGWMVGLGRLVAGIGFLATTVYLTKMIADWFDGQEIATAMSIFVMSWPLGIAMGQVGHSWIAELTEWRVPFMIASAYCGLAAIGIAVLYRSPQTAQTNGKKPETTLSVSEWQLIILAGLAWAIYNTGYVVFLSFAPAQLTQAGVSNLTAASIISVASWLMIFSGAICGWIMDQSGRRNLVLITCMISAVIALLILSYTPYSLAASILFGMVGVAPAGVIMAMGASAVRPERRAFAMGLFFTIYFAMLLGGPPVAGTILDMTGEPSASLLFAGVLFILVIPIGLAYGAIKKRNPT